MLEFELLAQFLFGIVGALVIIYLRVYEALPRMSGATLIKDLSQHAEQLREKLDKLVQSEKNSYTIEKLKVINNREKDIRREINSIKFKQWTLTASLYIILGGFFALVVYPLISQGKILLDGVIQPVEALKCMGIGFTWTTYISLLESKEPEKEARKIWDKSNEELKKKNTEIEQKVEDLEEEKAKLEKKAVEDTKRYDEVIASLKKDFDTYKETAKKLIKKYKNLLENEHE